MDEIVELEEEAVDQLEDEAQMQVSTSTSTTTTTPPMVRTTCEHIDVGRTMHVMKFSVNGECTERIRLRMGDSIHVNLEWENLETDCPGCIEQMYVGLRGTQLDCIFSDNESHDTSGKYQFDTNVLLPGKYYVVATSSWQYHCVDRVDGVVLTTVEVGGPAPHNAFIFFLAIIGFLSIIITFIAWGWKQINGKSTWQKIDVIFSDMPQSDTQVIEVPNDGDTDIHY